MLLLIVFCLHTDSFPAVKLIINLLSHPQRNVIYQFYGVTKETQAMERLLAFLLLAFLCLRFICDAKKLVNNITLRVRK